MHARVTSCLIQARADNSFRSSLFIILCRGHANTFPVPCIVVRPSSVHPTCGVAGASLGERATYSTLLGHTQPRNPAFGESGGHSAVQLFISSLHSSFLVACYWIHVNMICLVDWVLARSGRCVFVKSKEAYAHDCIRNLLIRFSAFISFL